MDTSFLSQSMSTSASTYAHENLKDSTLPPDMPDEGIAIDKLLDDIASLEMEIQVQPPPSCRARTPSEIKGMQQTTTKVSKAVGSRLVDQSGKNVALTLRCHCGDRIAGQLLGIPVSVGSDGIHQLHVYSLIGPNCIEGRLCLDVKLDSWNENIGKFEVTVDVGSVGIMKETNKEIKSGRTTALAMLAKGLYEGRLKPLFRSDSISEAIHFEGLSVDPMRQADGRMQILFVFVPADISISIIWCFTTAIECQTGAVGGKSAALQVRDVSIKSGIDLHWHSDGWLVPADNVWLDLSTAIRDKAISAELQLVTSMGTNMAADSQDSGPAPMPIPQELIEIRGSLVKLKLTQFPIPAVRSESLPERFEAIIRLVKTGGPGEGRQEEPCEVRLLLNKICQPERKRLRTEANF